MDSVYRCIFQVYTCDINEKIVANCDDNYTSYAMINVFTINDNIVNKYTSHGHTIIELI